MNFCELHVSLSLIGRTVRAEYTEEVWDPALEEDVTVDLDITGTIEAAYADAREDRHEQTVRVLILPCVDSPDPDRVFVNVPLTACRAVERSV